MKHGNNMTMRNYEDRWCNELLQTFTFNYIFMCCNIIVCCCELTEWQRPTYNLERHLRNQPPLLKIGRFFSDKFFIKNVTCAYLPVGY
jgi:hypothetical protein